MRNDLLMNQRITASLLDNIINNLISQPNCQTVFVSQIGVCKRMNVVIIKNVFRL